MFEKQDQRLLGLKSEDTPKGPPAKDVQIIEFYSKY
jgi:hypothetical protein